MRGQAFEEAVPRAATRTHATCYKDIKLIKSFGEVLCCIDQSVNDVQSAQHATFCDQSRLVSVTLSKHVILRSMKAN